MVMVVITAAISGFRNAAVLNTPDVGDGSGGGSPGDMLLYVVENTSTNVPVRRGQSQSVSRLPW